MVAVRCRSCRWLFGEVHGQVATDDGVLGVEAAVSADPAVAHADRPGEPGRDEGVVGDQHESGPGPVVDVVEEVQHGRGGGGVELAGGFIGEQQPRGVRDRDGDRDPLLFPAGQLPQRAGRDPGEAEGIEEVPRGGCPAGFGAAEGEAGEGDVT